MALDGKTPGEVAIPDLKLGDNKWHDLIKKSVESGIDLTEFDWKLQDQGKFEYWKNLLKNSGKPSLKKRDKENLDYWF
jgi:hypothetical protein